MMTYINPIIKGFNPDPSICYDGKQYILVTSSFEFFPCIPTYTSSDLVNWKPLGHVITDPSYINLTNIKNSMGLFAPTIRYNNGFYYVVCTHVTVGNFICYTSNLYGPWSKPIWIDAPAGIDPSLTFTEDKCYYQLAVFDLKNKIIQFQINPQTGERLSNIEVISEGCGGRDVEAPHIFKKNNYYYLVLAEGGTRSGHMVTIQRSKDINGPFESYSNNPILSNRNVKKELQAVGHGDIFEDHNGKWWVVALATRPIKHRTLLGRETILLPIEWEDGWPVVNVDGTADLTVMTDRNLPKQMVQTYSSNRFQESTFRYLGLKPEFNFANGALVLKANNTNIEIPNSQAVSFVSVSQEDYHMKMSLSIPYQDFEGKYGIAIYKDDDHLIEFGLMKDESGMSSYTIIKVSDLKIEKKEAVQVKENYIIEINGNELSYTFSMDGAEISSVLTRHFTKEASNSPFTGIQIGPFAVGERGVIVFNNIQLNYFKI